MDSFQMRAARRIAEQPINDRMDGANGDEAETVLVAALQASGLDRMDAVRVLETYGWHRFNTGVRLTRDAFTAADRGLKAAQG